MCAICDHVPDFFCSVPGFCLLLLKGSVLFQERYLADMDELFSQVDEKRKVRACLEEICGILTGWGGGGSRGGVWSASTPDLQPHSL